MDVPHKDFIIYVYCIINISLMRLDNLSKVIFNESILDVIMLNLLIFGKQIIVLY